MEKINFKKGLVLAIALLLSGTFFIPSVTGEINQASEPIEIFVNQNGDKIIINYNINEFFEEYVEIDESTYSIIKIGEESNLLIAGSPDIPSICRSIIIDDTAKMKVNVISSSYDEFENVLIAPSKGNLLRTVNPDDVPFDFGGVYSEDAWFPGDIATLREPYIVRDYRGQVVDIFPVQYNPVQKIMRVYNNIEVEVILDGTDNINIINRENLPEKVDMDYKNIYDHHFINFGMQGRYDPVGEQGNLLIICYDDFIDEMQPLVEWKTIMGVPTEIVKVSEIGNANAIKDYIANYYNDNGLTFVLLVGDAAQVPSMGSTASDPSYTYIVGDDHYPDLFVGRFSAQNAAQVETQVERSVEYEKNPQIGSEWYKKGLGVGSSQGAGIGDEGEADWEHLRNIRTLLMDYTYIQVDELYDGSQGGEDASGNPTPSMVAESVNDGRSLINYCGHGSPSGWGSSGFSTSDINSLVNDNMLPYVTCVACNNGQFDDYDECFCEAWLRATNNGEPAGAIVSTGSTVSMSWAPPMDGQDEMNDLIVESYENNIKHTFGGIHYNGVMHMNDEYGSSGIGETDYWTVFGDPSITMRTDYPAEMQVNHGTNIDLETRSLEVTVSSVAGALCALSRDGIFFGSAYTDDNGDATIQLNGNFEGTDPVDLIITAYNKIPYITTVLVNQAPQTPDKPMGPTVGKPHVEMTFSTAAIDPDDDQLYYKWSWGDGSSSDWLGPFDSATTATASHSYSDVANYGLSVKVKDEYGQESDYSEELWVNIEKSRSRPFFDLLENYPNLIPMLRLLIQLIGF